MSSIIQWPTRKIGTVTVPGKGYGADSANPLSLCAKQTPIFPALGYGAMSLGGAYGAPADDETRLKLLDRLYELGATNWDTARIYVRFSALREFPTLYVLTRRPLVQGDSEDIIGKWFARYPSRRAEIFLATKFGIDRASWQTRSDPPFIREQLETSLAKLQTDHIDLYYLHRPDSKTPIEVTMNYLVQLIK